MGLFQRVGDILSANFNDLIDRFEDPEKMLRQAIREMEALIAETLDGAAQSIATEKLIGKDLASVEQLSKAWQERAAKAVHCWFPTFAVKDLNSVVPSVETQS